MSRPWFKSTLKEWSPRWRLRVWRTSCGSLATEALCKSRHQPPDSLQVINNCGSVQGVSLHAPEERTVGKLTLYTERSVEIRFCGRTVKIHFHWCQNAFTFTVIPLCGVAMCLQSSLETLDQTLGLRMIGRVPTFPLKTSLWISIVKYPVRSPIVYVWCNVQTSSGIATTTGRMWKNEVLRSWWCRRALDLESTRRRKTLGGHSSGVPRGSVIGPLMFRLFVNDVPDVLGTLTLLFADDAKMVTRRSQSMNIHSSLTVAWDWSKKWDQPINPTKCNYLTIGRAAPLRLSFSPMGVAPPSPYPN